MIYPLRSRAEGAAMAPLSNAQKQKLAAMAHYAWMEVAPDQDFDDWRHDEVKAIVGKGGFRECVNADYNPLKARWLDLVGNATGEFKASFKSISEPRSWALFSLHKETKLAEDVMPRAMDYARGMIRNIAGINLDDATDKQIWRAVYAVRRKAQKLRREKRGGETAADGLGKLLGTAAGSKQPAAAKPKRAPARKCVEGPF